MDWNKFLNGDYVDDEENPFDGSDDEDEDYEPERDTDDDYDSDDDFLEQALREEMAVEEDRRYMSKDKQIKYTSEPLQAAGRPSTSARISKGVTAYAKGKVVDPLSAFLLFLEPIEDIILKMSNLYGVRKYKEDWKMLELCTLRAYFGLIILSGIFRSHGEDLPELWNNDYGRDVFRATMSLKQFKLIHQCIRFDDKNNREQRRERDKLAAIREVFDKWAAHLKTLYIPGENVTVAEQLVPYRGRCPFTMYIPSKPHKYGIKIWCLCDANTLYVYKMEVYLGKDGNCHTEVNQRERVVLRLIEGLEYRNVTCDNFFTSHKLALGLRQHKMTIVGNIRKNRKELPPILLDMKKQPVRHSQFMFDHTNKVSLVSYVDVPKKNKFVTLLSTYHKNKNIDGNDKNKPEIIQFYNKTKSGVDVLDEMVGTYRCTRKVNRWTMNLFGNMLDISGVNASIIFFSLFPNWNERKKRNRKRLFLIDIGLALIEPFIKQRITMPRGRNALSLVKRMKEKTDEPSDDEQQDNINEPSTSTSGIIKTAPGKRKRCHLCPPKRSTNVHSARCDKCKQAICREHSFQLCDDCMKPFL